MVFYETYIDSLFKKLFMWFLFHLFKIVRTVFLIQTSPTCKAISY